MGAGYQQRHSVARRRTRQKFPQGSLNIAYQGPLHIERMHFVSDVGNCLLLSFCDAPLAAMHKKYPDSCVEISEPFTALHLITQAVASRLNRGASAGLARVRYEDMFDPFSPGPLLHPAFVKRPTDEFKMEREIRMIFLEQKGMPLREQLPYLDVSVPGLPRLCKLVDSFF